VISVRMRQGDIAEQVIRQVGGPCVLLFVVSIIKVALSSLFLWRTYSVCFLL